MGSSERPPSRAQRASTDAEKAQGFETELNTETSTAVVDTKEDTIVDVGKHAEEKDKDEENKGGFGAYLVMFPCRQCRGVG